MEKHKQIFFDEKGYRKFYIIGSFILTGLVLLASYLILSYFKIFNLDSISFSNWYYYFEIFWFSIIGISISGQLILILLITLAFAFSFYHKIIKFHPALNNNYKPSVSIIVPCYNEEAVILKNVDALLSIDYPDIEIIVVDDGSKDQTFSILNERYINNDQIKVVTKPNGGKASALNYGISLSKGEIVVCIDADTVVMENSVKELVKHFSDPKVAAVAGNVKIGNEVNPLNWFQELEYIMGQNFDKIALSFINSVSVVPGALGAWRKSTLLEVGGYEYDTLVEDGDLTLTMIEKGYKVVYEPKAQCYTESPETWNSFFKQRNRWQLGTLQSVIKHRQILFSIKNFFFGFVGFPLILINFLFIYPLTLLSFYILFTNIILQLPFTIAQYFLFIITFVIVIFKLITSLILENKWKGKWKLILILPFYLEVYLTILAAINIYAILRAIWGINPTWGHLKRTGNVHIPKIN
jgi:peptidoglycan-N-acetylglucosamine deacetylase